jgi:hypothetical protein
MKKIALSTLALASVMAVGVAQAEPLTLTTNQMDEVTAGGNAFVDAVKNVNIKENILKRVDIKKTVLKTQNVNVQGFFAEADGGANCIGFGCQSTTFAITDVNSGTFSLDRFGFPTFEPGFATSVSGSEAAASGIVTND